MPIEIRELIIRTTIITQPRRPAPASAVDLQEMKREILTACLEEVRERLEQQMVR